ncbi:MAG TPA: DEAD/DEAH box helicase, partial [Turneriella sp.]|nr:DEAD/DEAH box helicase [Turneriella sp.]
MTILSPQGRKVHEIFHPAVSNYFERTFGAPTPVQLKAWQVLHGENSRQHALISAPTGEGKTLAAFLAIIDRLVRQAAAGEDIGNTRILYISPLKALANDIEKNLQQPLAGIRAELARMGIEIPEIQAMVRTGDSSQSERARLVRLRPQIVVTTPESFYLLLTSESGRRLLSTIETVIIDEIHALVAERRGAHLALSLARLEALRRDHDAHCRPLQRIGVSATVRPLERVAQYLAGNDPVRFCTDERRRPFDIRLLLPDEGLSAVMSGNHWNQIYLKLTEEIRNRRTTLVFVNNRRLCERMARSLSELIGAEFVGAHHGSLSHAERRRGEERLKAGSLKVMVATQSLELGLDIGSIDLVVQVSSPRSIHAFIQRAGRSEHHKQGTSRIILVPLTRDDLRECVALVSALRRGELEEVKLCAPALDVLAQQVVAEVSARDYAVDELFALFTGSFVYHDLQRSKFLQILQMLNDGFSLRFGRRSRYLFFDQTAGTLHARPGARLIAALNGGAIPENFEYEVVDETDQVYVGSVHEDFAIESMRGDVFQLGNRLWQIVQVSGNRVSVIAAPDKHPTIPFWIVDVPGRSDTLSAAVARLNEDFLAAESADHFVTAIARETGLEKRPLVLLADYLLQAKNSLGSLPTQQQVVLERFFDEVRNCHIVLHSPFGAQVNRAWGFALRKRFCRKFNFELQAA